MQSRLSTLTDVLNRSLGLLGADDVTDYASPDTEAGRKLKPWVLESIDEVQGSFLWQEIMTTTNIAKDGTDAYDGRSRFALPANCLRPLGFRHPTTVLPETAFTQAFNLEENEYEIEGNWLFAYGDEIDLVYNKREDDPTNWTAELGRCIYHAIAVNGGQHVTSDARIVQNVLEKYERLVRPRARLLQSKYKANARFLPRGFTYIRSHFVR